MKCMSYTYKIFMNGNYTQICVDIYHCSRYIITISSLYRGSKFMLVYQKSYVNILITGCQLFLAAAAGIGILKGD